MGSVACCRRTVALPAFLASILVLVGVLAVLPASSQAAPNDARAVQLSESIPISFRNSYNASNPTWPSLVPASSNTRKQLLAQLNELARLALSGGLLSPEARAAVFGRLKGEVLSYPGLLRQSTASGLPIYLPAMVFKPGMEQIRALIHGTMRNLQPGMTGTMLADALGFSGTRRSLLTATGIVALDANGLSEGQLAAVRDLYDNLPTHLVRPPAFTVNELLEVADADWHGFTGAIGGFNLDNAEIGSGSDAPFPPDVTQYPTAGFCAVLQHEQNHAVGAVNVQQNPTWRARETQLISRAGADASQYLRSQFGGPDKNDVDKDGNRTEGFFQAAPQEFFASIANQYLSSTERTFELALKRFRAGKREPLNQFLFYATVYSAGNRTPFFSQNSPCNYSNEPIEIGRGLNGWITRLTFDGTTYWFTTDAQGNVSAVRAGTVAVNGWRQLVYRAASLEKNQVTVSRQGADIVIRDPGGSAYPWAAPCRATAADTVACQAQNIDQVVVFTGDRDDTVTNTTTLPIVAWSGKGNDMLEGNSGDDALIGEDDQDELRGGGGADWLIGGAGGDTLDGGPGLDNDLLLGEAGTDTVDYSNRTRRVVVDLAGEFGGEEAGERDQVKAVENVRGGSGDDQLLGSTGRNLLDGNAGDDSLDGRTGTNDLEGGDGNDTLFPSSDGDWLSGGPNVDTIDFSSQTNPVTFDLSRPLVGQYGINILMDTDVENLIGGSGNDKLTGNAGSNNLVGGSGKDELRGAGGTDTADFSDHTTAVNVSIDGVANDGSAGEQDNVFTDVENLIGGSGADKLTGSGQANRLEGGRGANELDGSGGDDFLIGGIESDRFEGGAGNDTTSYADHSAVQPVAVNLSTQTGGDSSSGESDTLHTIENLRGGEGADQLTGDANPNIIRAGEGDDILDGGLGADRLDGGGGSDFASYAGRTANVRVTLSDSADDPTGNDGQGCPGASCEKDNVSTNNVIGGAGNDTMIGDLVPNILVGCQGDDQLTGGTGAGDFLLDGLPGSCTGSGSDTFFAADGASDSADCGTGGDHYTSDIALDSVDADCEQRLAS